MRPVFKARQLPSGTHQAAAWLANLLAGGAVFLLHPLGREVPVARATPSPSLIAQSGLPTGTEPSELHPSGQAEKVASYRISARLDTDRHTIAGHATLRFTNTSLTALNELWFHLYLNAFEHDRTLFLRSPWGASRSRRNTSDYGYIEVKKLTSPELGSGNLWASAAPHSPDDPDDRTDIRVPIPASIGPGTTVTLDLEFEAKLPQIVERTGHAGNFYMVAQWFPKLAKLEANGSFAHFAFHPNAEFYADFGDYQVDLDVPADLVVGATGERRGERLDQGRQHLRYQASNVHDFAWTAWAGFRRREESIGPVQVKILYPPDHERNTEATLVALRQALPSFSRRYGPYAWPTLTVVDPPETARSAGGMEYPTLITTGGSWFDTWVGREVETVVVHELGHQWFYGMVASNEAAWPFLDEGLTTYVESRFMAEQWGSASATDLLGIRISADALRRVAHPSQVQSAPIAQSAASFADFSSIGALVYARTGTLFETLENVYGQERISNFVGRYARRYRFLHPEPADFLSVARDTLGEKLEKTLRTALFDRGWVNYRAENLECALATVPGGSFPGPTPGEREVRRRTPLEPKLHLCRARLVREGTLEFPVQVELIDDQGQRTRELWDDSQPSRFITHEGERPIVTVVVDPDRRVTLDSNLLDNAVQASGREPWVTRSQLTYWIQVALRWLGP